MGRVPIEIFGVSKFFYRKFVKKNFRGRGPQKSTILGLFSKIDVRNFCQLGKNVFFELPFFFEKSRKWGLILIPKNINYFFIKENRPTLTTFWCDKIKMWFFFCGLFCCWLLKKKFFSQKFLPSWARWGPFFERGAPKIGVFSRNSTI